MIFQSLLLKVLIPSYIKNNILVFEAKLPSWLLISTSCPIFIQQVSACTHTHLFIMCFRLCYVHNAHIHKCNCVCENVHTSVTRKHVHASTHKSTQICFPRCICTHAHACTACMKMHTHAYTCMHKSVCTCLHLYA